MTVDNVSKEGTISYIPFKIYPSFKPSTVHYSGLFNAQNPLQIVGSYSIIPSDFQPSGCSVQWIDVNFSHRISSDSLTLFVEEEIISDT